MRANSKLKSSEYSGPVLGLIFLRYADHKALDEELETLNAEARELEERIAENVAKLLENE